MIEKLQKAKLDLQAITVYDFNELTLQELLCKFYEKINECVEVSNESLTFLEWLKGEGLHNEVIAELENMYQDGRLTEIINNLSGDVKGLVNAQNEKITSLDSKIEVNKQAIEVNKQSIETLNTSLSEFKEQTTTELESHLNKIKNICVTTSDFNIVGDGITNNADKIQEFLDYCSTNQVIGKVKQGVYILEKQIKIKSNTTLIFEDGAEFKQTHTNTMINIQENHFTLYNGYSNIKIFGGVFNCNGMVISDPMNCFFIQHASNVLFNGCTFKNIQSYHALDINGSKDIIVRNCIFLNSYNSISYETREAIQIDLSAPTEGESETCWDYTPTKNVIVENCYFGRDNNQANYFTSAIGSHNIRFNKFYDNIVIRDNIIDGNENYAINGWKWINSTIENNIISSTKGIKLDTPHQGAESTKDVNGVYKGLQESYNNKIINNTITCNTDGIFIRGKWVTTPQDEQSQSGLISQCEIRGNKIEMVTGTSPCITLLNAYNCKVLDNICNKSGDDGIRVYSSYSNIVSGNIINDSSNYGICINNKTLSGTDGCQINTDNVITNNIIKKTYKSAIFISNSSSTTSIDNNTISECNTSNLSSVSIIDISAGSNFINVTNNKISSITTFKNLIFITNTCNSVLVSNNISNVGSEGKYYNASIGGVLTNNI